MKRSKKQNESTPGQLCLFEVPGIRQQEEERRTKPRKKPAAPSKPAALTFIPPATVKSPEMPENTFFLKADVLLAAIRGENSEPAETEDVTDVSEEECPF